MMHAPLPSGAATYSPIHFGIPAGGPGFKGEASSSHSPKVQRASGASADAGSTAYSTSGNFAFVNHDAEDSFSFVRDEIKASGASTRKSTTEK